MRWILELVVSTAYGLAGAVVPVFNFEAYVVAAQATGLGALLPVVMGLSVGNSAGKTLVLWLLRQGRRLPWWRDRPRGATSDGRWRRFLDRLLELVGGPWGGWLVLLAAATSVPPLYPTILAAAASRMRLTTVALAVFTGTVLRQGAIGLGAAGLL